MITCRELIDFLMDYVGGALPDDERARFDEHLAVCPHCVAYLRTYRDTIELGTALAPADRALPEPVPEELVQAILAARASGAP